MRAFTRFKSSSILLNDKEQEFEIIHNEIRYSRNKSKKIFDTSVNTKFKVKIK